MLKMFVEQPLVSDMEKYNFFLHEQGLSQNYFTQNRCVNYNSCEFAIKQGKMYLTTTISKMGLPHNYRGNIQLTNYIFSPKSAKLQHNLLLRQNSVEFVTDFTQTMKTQCQGNQCQTLFFFSSFS